MKAVALIALVLIALAARPAAGQAGGYGVLVEAQAAQPLFGLADRFGAAAGAAVGVGRWTDERTYWELRLQSLAFTEGDVTLHADTTGPAIDAGLLDLGLDVRGGAVRIRRLLAIGVLRPFVGAGAGLYHWTDRRGAYETDALSLPAAERSQWSAGFHGAAGLEWRAHPRAGLQGAVDYALVMGELWPTLALGLENVSTFHTVSARLGLRIYL